MVLPSALAIAVSGLCVVAAVVTPASASPDPLAALRWTKRVLLVSAPSDTDPLLLAQRRIFGAMRHGADQRDLVLVEAVGSSQRASAIRGGHNLDGATFTALLIGKDGGTKLRSTTPLGAEALFPIIDAMPMRQDELRRVQTP